MLWTENVWLHCAWYFVRFGRGNIWCADCRGSFWAASSWAHAAAIPILRPRSSPQNFKAKTKHGSKRTGVRQMGRRRDFSAGKPGPTTALRVENPALRCSIFHPTNARSHWSSIKKKNSRITVIPAVDPPIASGTRSHKPDCKNNRSVLRCLASSLTLAAQIPGTRDPGPSGSCQEENDLRLPSPSVPELHCGAGSKGLGAARESG